MRRMLFHKFGLVALSVLLTVMLFYSSWASAETAFAQTVAKTLAITLERLGYQDVVLHGPLALASYSFSLPPDWIPEAGSFVELDVDYTVGPKTSDQPLSAQMEVSLNNKSLHVEPFQDTSVSRKIRVGIPTGNLFSYEDDATNLLNINFVVDASCEDAREVNLTIKNISALNLGYSERPPILDLAFYPQPIYQPRGFEPQQLYILHSAQPSAGELQAITMISAKLGEVTGSDFVITTTAATSVSETQLANSSVLIVGSPEDNPLIPQLSLPIPAIRRQLGMWSEMPAMAVRGQVFSYTLHVQNTSQTDQSLNLVDRLPKGTTFLSCTGECQQGKPGQLSWKLDSLPAGSEASFAVVVTVNESTPPDQQLEHLAILYDSNNIPLNADSLAIQLGVVPGQQFVSSSEQKGTYFFTQNGVTVAESDGLVQEIQSPWSNRYIALVVTGQNDEALTKAAYALSGQNKYPGMVGQYAIVQETRPYSSTAEVISSTFTLAQLGYPDHTLKGGVSLDSEYRFKLPTGWKVSEDARFNLRYADAAAFSEISSTLNIRLNDLIIAGTALGRTDAISNSLIVPLPQNSFKIGRNRLGLSVDTSFNDKCVDITGDRFWLTVFSDSSFWLPHETAPSSTLDLDFYPYPFVEDPDLNNLVIALPNPVSPEMVQELASMAFMLGNESSSAGFSPKVIFADQSSLEEWRDYNIVAIGLPTDNSFIAQVNDKLPQPFYPGTTEILQRVNNVIFRLPPDISLGFVQELRAPLNPQRSMLVVTGTNDEGLGWAQAVMGNDLAFDLVGNLAIIHGTDIQNIDTRSDERQAVLASTQRLAPELRPVATVTPTPSPTPTPEPPPTNVPEVVQQQETATAPQEIGNFRPIWLQPLLIFSVALLVVASGVAIWQSRH